MYKLKQKLQVNNKCCLSNVFDKTKISTSKIEYKFYIDSIKECLKKDNMSTKILSLRL